MQSADQVDDPGVQEILRLAEAANARGIARRRRRFRRRVFLILAAVLALCAAAAFRVGFEDRGNQSSKRPDDVDEHRFGGSTGVGDALDSGLRLAGGQARRPLPRPVPARHPCRSHGPDERSPAPRDGRETPAGQLSLARLGARQVRCPCGKCDRRRRRHDPLTTSGSLYIAEKWAGRPSSAATREAGPRCRAAFPPAAKGGRLGRYAASLRTLLSRPVPTARHVLFIDRTFLRRVPRFGDQPRRRLRGDRTKHERLRLRPERPIRASSGRFSR